jgi:lipid-binding SYLF domain-containing protein
MTTRILTVLALVLTILAAGCATAPKTADDAAALKSDCDKAIAMFKDNDPSLKENFFDTAQGYAVFPTVGKGGVGVGGAYGKGQVYEGGKLIGYTTLSQGSIGLQLGGQSYSEIVFFQTKTAMDSFKEGEFALAAQATAVAASAGASADAAYTNGVAVFTAGQKGLMAEAVVGGQNFTFDTLDAAQEAMAKD